MCNTLIRRFIRYTMHVPLIVIVSRGNQDVMAILKIVAASNYAGHVPDSPTLAWCVYSCVSRRA